MDTILYGNYQRIYPAILAEKQTINTPLFLYLLTYALSESASVGNDKGQAWAFYQVREAMLEQLPSEFYKNYDFIDYAEHAEAFNAAKQESEHFHIKLKDWQRDICLYALEEGIDLCPDDKTRKQFEAVYQQLLKGEDKHRKGFLLCSICQNPHKYEELLNLETELGEAENEDNGCLICERCLTENYY